jgi:hypothetical protein
LINSKTAEHAVLPTEQHRMVHLLADKVSNLQEDCIEVALHGEGLGSVVGEITAIFELAIRQ